MPDIRDGNWSEPTDMEAMLTHEPVWFDINENTVHLAGHHLKIMGDHGEECDAVLRVCPNRYATQCTVSFIDQGTIRFLKLVALEVLREAEGCDPGKDFVLESAMDD